MMIDYIAYLVLALIVVVFLASSIRILREYHRGVVFTFQPGTVDQRILASPTWSHHQNKPTRPQQAGLQLHESTRFHSSTHATLLPRCQTVRTTGTRSIIRTRIRSARLPGSSDPI